MRFSLAALMIGTTCVAIAFAVLPYPFIAYYLLLTFFFVAACLYRFGPTEARSFWRRFAATGWLYVFIGTSLLEMFETTPLWHSIRSWLQHNNPSPYKWNPNHYLIFAHSLIAFGVAISGAFVLPLLGRCVCARKA